MNDSGCGVSTAPKAARLMIADDVHWLDGPTQDVLAFIARRVSADPIVLIGSLRTGIDAPFARAGLPELLVQGLEDAAAREVMMTHAGDLSYASRERILATSRGNPLALVELPIALRGTPEASLDALPLTARLERAFAARIADLQPLARDVVLVAAVDYSNEVPEILAAASALAGQPVGVDMLQRAAEAALIRFDDLHVRFGHPLVRSGVLQLEPVTRRYAANAALAEVLVDEPFRRTWHRAQSITGPDDEVADELEASHLISLRRGSATGAIWALERVRAAHYRFGRSGPPPAAGRRARLRPGPGRPGGPASRQGGRYQPVRPAAGQDGVAAGDLQRRRARRRSPRLRAVRYSVRGDRRRRRRPGPQPAAGGRVAMLVGRHRDRPPGPASPRSPACSEDARSDPRYAAAVGVAEPVLQGRLVIELLHGVVLESVADPGALWLLGMAAHAVGEPVSAVGFLGRAETKLREQGRLGLLSQVLTMQVLDHLELGTWDRAEAVVEEGRRLAQETGQPIWDIGTLVLSAIVMALRGQSERAEAIAAEAEQAARGRRLNDLLACAQLARGLGGISAGRYTEAYAALRPLFDPADPAFHLTERFHGVMFLAEAAVHAGQAEDARSVIAALGAEAAITPSETLARHLSYARAVLAEDDDAQELFLAALGAPLVRWPWVKARLELAYGSWLRRQRRVAESRLPLRSAQTTFDLIGAGSWAEQARSELRAAGERTAAQEPSAHGVLSAQELQIARLAAEGMSNREIGERLYLSPRTFGSHLYRIFPKLDITSRAQLASRLESA